MPKKYFKPLYLNTNVVRWKSNVVRWKSTSLWELVSLLFIVQVLLNQQLHNLNIAHFYSTYISVSAYIYIYYTLQFYIKIIERIGSLENSRKNNLNLYTSTQCCWMKVQCCWMKVHQFLRSCITTVHGSGVAQTTTT